MKSSIIASVVIGTEVITGIDWPIENVLTRIGPREWQVTFELCNGTARASRTFRTKREGLEAVKAPRDQVGKFLYPDTFLG